jgi:6-pyruvoyltetrahydropterin/6-carboxytetrahydropterin synthase
MEGEGLSSGYPRRIEIGGKIKGMVYLTRKIEFSASHLYHNPNLSAEENRRIFGKCNNPHGHGHNYALEVTVSGQVDPNGMVCNLVDLDTFVGGEVLERFDHMNLNLLPEFVSEVPTTENLCIRIYDILKRGFHPAHLEKVRLEETMMNSFEYTGGTNARG